jgi:hypothetical protein
MQVIELTGVYADKVSRDKPRVIIRSSKVLSMQRVLIVLGLVILAAGILWPWLSRLPLGRLPGDLVVDRPGFRLFAPFTTMIIVSVVLSLIVWLLRR